MIDESLLMPKLRSSSGRIPRDQLVRVSNLDSFAALLIFPIFTTDYIQHVQAFKTADMNGRLAEMNAQLLIDKSEAEKEILSLRQELFTYQARVRDAFMAKLMEQKENIITQRNELRSTLKKSILKPMDEVISILNEVGRDVVVFKSPDRLAIRPESSNEVVIQRSSFAQVRQFAGSPSSRKSFVSAAEVKENLKASGQIRARKLIISDNAPLTPLLELSTNSVTDILNVDEDDVQEAGGHEANGHNMDFTMSPMSEQFVPMKTSTERKKRSTRIEGRLSNRLSIFNFTPATPQASDDQETTLLSEHRTDLQDTTLSMAQQNIPQLEASFLDHSSFRERFGVDANGRSTEIAESTIDDTPPVTKHNLRTIRSSNFGDLTDSPQTIAHDLSPGTSAVGMSPSSTEQELTPEIRVKEKKGKRKTAEAKTGSKAKKSPVKSSRSQSAAKSLSSIVSDPNHSSMNSTAANDQTYDMDASTVKDRPRRARNEVSYKEPPLGKKLRRNF